MTFLRKKQTTRPRRHQVADLRLWLRTERAEQAFARLTHLQAVQSKNRKIAHCSCMSDSSYECWRVCWFDRWKAPEVATMSEQKIRKEGGPCSCSCHSGGKKILVFEGKELGEIRRFRQGYYIIYTGKDEVSWIADGTYPGATFQNGKPIPGMEEEA